MNEQDIWRAADWIIESHGDQAECVACDRIEDMIEAADPIGERVWKQILAAVKQLQRSCPGSREFLH
jgi:ferritin-like metal-binding protein YciE